MIGLSIFYPDCSPARDTTGWTCVNCGVWWIGSVKHHVRVFHAPDSPPPDLATVLAEAFQEYRVRGIAVVKVPDPQ
jgi:hypothetical protein